MSDFDSNAAAVMDEAVSLEEESGSVGVANPVVGCEGGSSILSMAPSTSLSRVATIL